jgi:outer membrane biosynthesis protein TonB
LQVSIDNLPLESASSKSATSTHASVLPANAFAHVAPVTITRPAAAPTPRPPTAAERAAERKRVKREAALAAASTSQKASSDSDDDDDDKAAAPPPPPAPTKGPDRAAIAKAVGRAAAAATSCDEGPRQGRAVITFAPSGNVQSVGLVESFGDNAVNGCVLRALGRAHVPPFVGGSIEVRKGLSW